MPSCDAVHPGYAAPCGQPPCENYPVQLGPELDKDRIVITQQQQGISLNP